MTKYFVIISALLLLVGGLGNNPAFGQNKSFHCGQTNCTGQCGRFTDQNGDGFCDLGFMTNFRADTVAKNDNKDTVKKGTTVHNSHNQVIKTGGIRQNINQSASDTVANNQLAQNDSTKVNKIEVSPQKQNTKNYPYDLILISGLTLGMYFLTYILYKTKTIRKQIHRRIWNSLLLLTFLGSGIIGLLLVIQINYHIWLGIYRDFLYWHVQLGIAMALISILHALWHISYFKKLFNKLPKTDPEC